MSKYIIEQSDSVNSSIEIQISPNASNSETPKKTRKIKNPKKSKRVPIKKGQWSAQEDKLLEQWVKINGPKNWEACGRFIQGRKGKQCREHWNNCLNPELIKGDWTSEEDFLIMFFYEKCNGSWKKIIPLFNGRIENSIKNRFYSQLRKYATKNMTSKERKRACARIKLHELKNYLHEALTQAKIDLLKATKMNEEQFNLFVINNEQKLKINTSEDSDNLEANLSTNYGGSIADEESDKKNLLLRKRERTEDELDSERNKEETNNLTDLEKNKFPFDKENSERILGLEEKYFDNFDKNDILYQNNLSNDLFPMNNSYDKYISDINNITLNNNNNIFDYNKNEKDDESSVNNFDFQKNSFVNIFKVDNYMDKIGIEKSENINFDENILEKEIFKNNYYISNLFEEKNKFDFEF